MASSFPFGKSHEHGDAGDVGTSSPSVSLHQLLADEKQRCEQHRNNYQTLKSQHSRLQDTLRSVTTEVNLLKTDRQSVSDKYHKLVSQFQREMAAKDATINDLKGQIPSREQQEYREMQACEEVRANMREKFLRNEEDLEEARNEYTSLRLEHSAVCNELERIRNQQDRQLEEVRLQYDTRCNELLNELDSLKSKHLLNEEEMSERLRPVQRENTALQIKLKNIRNDLDEAKSENENLMKEKTEIRNNLDRRETETTIAMKLLEGERNQWKGKCDHAENELASCQKTLCELQLQLQRQTGQITRLEMKVSEANHRHKQVITDFECQISRLNSDSERDSSSNRRRINELEHQLEMARIDRKQCESRAEKLELELDAEVQKRCEEHWNKVKVVRQKLVEIENALQTAEAEKLQANSEKADIISQCEDRVREVNEMKLKAERELHAMKIKIQSMDDIVKKLEDEKAASSELRQEINARQSNITKLGRDLLKMNSDSEELKKEISILKDLAKSSEEKLTIADQLAASKMKEANLQWEEEKKVFKQRLVSLEDERNQLNNQLTADRRKRHRYGQLIHKLRDRTSQFEAEKVKLIAERDLLSLNVPLDLHNKLRREVRDLHRKHREFSQVLRSLQTPGIVDLNPGLSLQLKELQTRMENVNFGDRFGYDSIDRPPPARRKGTRGHSLPRGRRKKYETESD